MIVLCCVNQQPLITELYNAQNVFNETVVSNSLYTIYLLSSEFNIYV